LQIEIASPDQMRQKPQNTSELKFGQVFSDHMIEVDWTEGKGWERPRICALRNFQFHPAAKVG
jgi:branched-chain amino acid aminotransferase